jgi:hypothetical protein
MNINLLKQKMLLLFSSIFLLPLIVGAQVNTLYGTVGNQVIDQTFINSLQLLSPDFGFTPNAEAFKVRLLKNYVLVKTKADAFRSRPAYKSDAVQKELAMIKQLAEDKYLATLYDRHQNDSVLIVSDAEARAYYDTHILQFTQPGHYSYFTAYVADTLKNSVPSVLNQLKQYAAIIKEDFKTGDKSTYYVTYEKDKSVSANDFNHSILSKLKTGEHSLAANGGGNAVIVYMLGNKTQEVVTSFDKVKEQCKAMVTNAKRDKLVQDFVESAQRKYPVTLDSPLFK